MFQEGRLIKVIRLNPEHDNHGAMMRLTFGDTHYRNYELGFSVKTNVKEKDQEVVDDISRKGDRPLIFSRKTKKKKKPSLQPPAWCCIISPGLTPRLKFIIDGPSNQQPLQFSPIHLWPVSEANCLSWGHWAAKMAHTPRLGMSPARSPPRSSADVHGGERPRER